MEEDERPATSGSPANHICILVHGLWGNPGHLNTLETALKEKHGERLHVLVAKRNRDNFTYDGIEVGGERLAQEIEDELEELDKKGHKITKMSLVGYSLGGLVARYCVGLLFSRGIFDRIEPVNFTAFASPFLGTRAPITWYPTYIFNEIGGRMISESGRQLFLIDKFRDTGRPLLELLADSSTIFIRGLKKFKHRVLYANAVNDRSAPWYTTSISRSDPFEDLSKVDLKYQQGYTSVLLDPDNPVQLKNLPPPDLYTRALNTGSSFVNSMPLYLMLCVFLPLGFTAFSINSGIQSLRSSRRVKSHYSGKAGKFDMYRFPYKVMDAFDTMAATAPNEHLDKAEESTDEDQADKPDKLDGESNALYRTRSRPEFPVLALDPKQFEMIENLNEVGFRKYPVYISKALSLLPIGLTRNLNCSEAESIKQSFVSHAAIIVRAKRSFWDEGHAVIAHWIDKEFEL